MDKSAAKNATDKDLKEFGLTEKGDIIALRMFWFNPRATSSPFDDHVMELKMGVKHNRRLEQKSVVKDKSKCALVWAKCGEGTRTVKVKETCTEKELLEILEKLLYPNMKASFELCSLLSFKLGTFNQKGTKDTMEVNGVMVP